MRDVDVRRLVYFVAVGEELHFGRAAKRLHMSQPKLSQQIRALEAELGVLLFERNRRSVRLTSAGETLLDHAAEVQATLSSAIGATQRAARGEGGLLRVGYSSSALYSTKVLAALALYRKKFPKVQIDLLEGSTRTQVERLLAGSIDIGLLRGPLPAPAAALKARSFFNERLVAVLPPQHPLAAKKELRIADLLEEPLVIYPRDMGTSLNQQLFELFAVRGAAPVVTMEAFQMSSIFGLVGAGVGVSIAPACVTASDASRVAVRPLSDEDANSELHTVVGERLNRQAENLMELLHARKAA